VFQTNGIALLSSICSGILEVGQLMYGSFVSDSDDQGFSTFACTKDLFS